VRYELSTTHPFHSSHRLDEPVVCSRTHGHEYHIRATVIHEDIDSGGMPRGSADLRRVVGIITDELDYRDLSEMLPGILTTTTGLAAWFFERLAAHFPGLTRVDVWHEFERGTAIK